MLMRMLLPAILWICCVTNVVAAPTLNLTDLQKPVLVQASEPQFTVNLKANRTTGYLWLLQDYDANLIQPQAHQYLSAGSIKAMGVPGISSFEFKATPAAFAVPQVTTLNLVYVRPWDFSKAGSKTVTVIFLPSQSSPSSHAP